MFYVMNTKQNVNAFSCSCKKAMWSQIGTRQSCIRSFLWVLATSIQDYGFLSACSVTKIDSSCPVLGFYEEKFYQQNVAPTHFLSK
jgi:hypothetical protein